MNVIKRLVFCIFISLAIVGCSNENLNSKEAVEYFKNAESGSMDQELQKVNPYLSEQDILVFNIVGYVFDLKLFKIILDMFDVSLNNYQTSPIDLIELITYWFMLCAIGATFGFIVRLFLVLLKGATGDADGFKGEIKTFGWKVIGFTATYFFAIFGFVSILIILAAALNAASSNAINSAYNSNLINLNENVTQVYKRSEFAELFVSRALEQVRTEQARTFRRSSLIDRGDTFNDLAETSTELSGVEVVTNVNRTIDWADFIFSWGLGHSAYKFFTSEKYVSDIQFFGKRDNSFFSTDGLNFPSSNFSISLTRDAIVDKEDLNAGDDNTLKRRNIIASGMNETGIDAFANYNNLQARIATSLQADSTGYAQEDYLNEINTLKDKFISVFNRSEADIKEFKTEAERVELTSSLMMFTAAQAIGQNRNEDLVKIFNSMTLSMQDWVSANCVLAPDVYELHTKNLDKLNNSGAGIYDGYVKWDSTQPDCVLPAGNEFKNLAHRWEDIDAVKAKNIEAKSAALAMVAHKNIVSIAAKEAVSEVMPKISNSINECLKYQLLGFIAMPMQLPCIVASKHRKDSIASKLDEVLKIEYANAYKENNNFVDEMAVFGKEGDKNYLKESDRQPILDIFHEMPIAQLFDTDTLPSGNYATIKTQEENIEQNLADKMMEEFQDMIMGPISKGTKYSAGFPQSMTIQQGKEYCARTGCPEIYKPSLYESVSISGQLQTDTAMTCIIYIAGVKAVNSTLDFGDTANAASSGVGGKSAAAGKGVGKVLKFATEGANAAAETAQIPCYIMLGTGITSGTILPALFMISLVGPIIILIINLIAMLFILPVAFGIDIINPSAKLSGKAIKRTIAVFVNVAIIVSGMLLTFAVLLMPIHWFARILIAFGFGEGSGVLSQVLVCFALIIGQIQLWKYANSIGENFSSSIMNFLNLQMDMNAAKQYNQQLLAATAVLASTHQIGRVADSISNASQSEFAILRKSFEDRIRKEDLQKQYDNSSRPKEANFAADDKQKDEMPIKLPDNLNMDLLKEKLDKPDDESKK